MEVPLKSWRQDHLSPALPSRATGGRVDCRRAQDRSIPVALASQASFHSYQPSPQTIPRRKVKEKTDENQNKVDFTSLSRIGSRDMHRIVLQLGKFPIIGYKVRNWICMKKKFTFQSAFFNARTLVTLLICTAAVCSITAGTLFAFLGPQASSNVSQKRLTFTDRVAYQRAIEEVYWRHRIWPKQRRDTKPSLDAVMSQAQIEKKVEHYLRDSQALENYWQRPITPEQLQGEM
jgi:hypothetical protein